MSTCTSARNRALRRVALRIDWGGRLVVVLLLAAPSLLRPYSLSAQSSKPERGEATSSSTLEWIDAIDDDDRERYLRVLQVDGVVPLYPWTLRRLSARELAGLAPRTPHPWRARAISRAQRTSAWSATLLGPEVRTVYNSSFPFGSNDGPMWAGRGWTTAMKGGVVVRAGFVTLVVDPVYFLAQNASFSLDTSAWKGTSPLANPSLGFLIDLPQRFGERRYARFDLGQSTLRVDLPGVAAGLSAADQWWGPASSFPLILGNNAGGFNHAFVGSSAPWKVGIGRLHVRLTAGQLEQSDYSPAPIGKEKRLMAGAVAAFTPRGVPGLEIGGARFFHQPMPAGGFRLLHFTIPLGGFTLRSVDAAAESDTIAPTNQLASAFARWVHPGSGVEVYGEFMRNDRNADLRDLTLEPDHDAAYMVGLLKTWHSATRDRVFVMRGEVVNAMISHLARVRYQSWPYTHSLLVQGHTQRGQALGTSAIEQSGGGGVVGIDLYRPTGRSSVELSRIVRRKPFAEGAPLAQWDVQYVLALNGSRLMDRWEWRWGAGIVYELNRDFHADVGNLNVSSGFRFRGI